MSLRVSDDIEPSPAQLERWQRTFVLELHAARRRRRHRFALAAGSAAAAALALVLWWPGAPVAPASPVARVLVAFGGVVVREDGEVPRRLGPGDIVRDGDRVQSGHRSGLGVVYAGGDVRLDEQTEVVFRDEELELISGGLYLDSEPGSAPAADTLRVRTPAGIISHVGTQFLVRVDGARVEAAVREGGIVLQHGDRELLLEAGDGAARRLVVGASGEVRQDAAAATGGLWSWALRAAAGMSLQGQSADAVLRWAAREQGRRLVYQDARSEALARQEAVLSAPREPVDPLRAVDLVDAATRLSVDQSDPQVLRVFMASEGDQHAQ